MGYAIRDMDYHRKAIEQLSRESQDRAERQVDVGDGALSSWANGANSSYHNIAIDLLKLGDFIGIDHPADYVDVLMEKDGGRRVDARRYYGQYGYYWSLSPAEAERFGRKYIPCGERSRVQRELGLMEERRILPVQPFLDAHCPFVGAAMSFSSVPYHVDEAYKVLEQETKARKEREEQRLASLPQIDFANRERIGFSQHAWSDETRYRVAFTPLDATEADLRKVLDERHPHGNGYSSLRYSGGARLESVDREKGFIEYVSIEMLVD